MAFHQSMARFLFITLYDEYCLGARQLVANLRAGGHEAFLLCMKQYGKKTLADGENPEPEWQIELLPNGSRAVLCYPFEITEREKQLAREFLKRLKPDIVGFSVYTPQLARAIEVTRLARKALPETPIVWGGPHPTLDPEESCRHAGFVIVGEADVPVMELAAALDNGAGWRELPGAAFVSGGALIRNPPAPVVDNLDSLPSPWHENGGVFYLDNDELAEGVPFAASGLRDTHKIMTTRGCPYACSYCMLSYYKEIAPHAAKLRFRSVAHVISELEREKARRGSFYLEIEDDIFTLKPERMEKFFSAYREKIAMPFWCYTHPNYARDPALKILRDNNAQYIIMGIESGSERIANGVFNRRTDNSAVIEAARRINGHGLRVFCDLISNNPFESEEDRTETFHLLRSLPRPFELQLVELSFYPNIRIERLRTERGLPRKAGFQQYRFWNALYHLASAIEISDGDAARLLGEPALRNNPALLEHLAGEVSRLARSEAGERARRRNLETETARLAREADSFRGRLDDITRRRGHGCFLRLSDKLRAARKLLGA